MLDISFYTASPAHIKGYIHHQRLLIGDCVRDLEIIAKVSEPEECANRVQYLPL